MWEGGREGEWTLESRLAPFLVVSQRTPVFLDEEMASVWLDWSKSYEEIKTAIVDGCVRLSKKME